MNAKPVWIVECFSKNGKAPLYTERFCTRDGAKIFADTCKRLDYSNALKYYIRKEV